MNRIPATSKHRLPLGNWADMMPPVKWFSDFYVEYELRFVPADPARKGQVLSELHQRIQDGFHGAGLQIMSPHFESQPSDPVLPPASEDPAG